MSPDLKRVAEVAHYVVARTKPSDLGITKLHKVLWYADLEHYRRHGRSLTTLNFYERMPQGPMSKAITKALSQLRARGDITIRPTKVIDYTRQEIIWLKEPDISSFSAEAIDILNRVIDVVCPQTASEASDSTHGPLWQELANGDIMPIGAASIVSRPPTPGELAWAQAQVS